MKLIHWMSVLYRLFPQLSIAHNFSLIDCHDCVTGGSDSTQTAARGGRTKSETNAIAFVTYSTGCGQMTTVRCCKTGFTGHSFSCRVAATAATTATTANFRAYPWRHHQLHLMQLPHSSSAWQTTSDRPTQTSPDRCERPDRARARTAKAMGPVIGEARRSVRNGDKKGRKWRIHGLQVLLGSDCCRQRRTPAHLPPFQRCIKLSSRCIDSRPSGRSGWS